MRKISLVLILFVYLTAMAQDKVVPLDYSKRAQQTYKNATLKIKENAGHGFKPEQWKIDAIKADY